MSATAGFLYMRVSTSPARRVIRYERVYVNCRLQQEVFFLREILGAVFFSVTTLKYLITRICNMKTSKKISATMWNSPEKCRQNAEVAAGKITANFKIKQWGRFPRKLSSILGNLESPGAETAGENKTIESRSKGHR